MPETSATFSSRSSSPPSSSPPSSAAERERILAKIEEVLPALFAIRLGKKKVKSIGFFVSQYWNDEADDAVHGELRPSFKDGEFHRMYEDEEGASDDVAAFDSEFSAADVGFDSNGEMIDAFASYACESSQDDPEYVCYCIWRPEGGTFVRTVVGTMLRPAWEDHRLNAPAQEAAASSSSKKPFPKWWVVVAPLVLYALLKLLSGS